MIAPKEGVKDEIARFKQARNSMCWNFLLVIPKVY